MPVFVLQGLCCLTAVWWEVDDVGEGGRLTHRPVHTDRQTRTSNIAPPSVSATSGQQEVTATLTGEDSWLTQTHTYQIL